MRQSVFGQQLRHRHFRIERQLAEHRVGAVNGLDFDQCDAVVGGARHAAQRRCDRHFAARTQKRDFFRPGFALHQGEGDVAAEQGAALARQPLVEARRDRADPGDRHDAERDAGDEDVKATQPAAQFAQGVAQRQRRSAAAGGGFGGHAHEAASRSAGCGFDPAGTQPHHAVAALRQRGVMGHQHQGHAALGVLGEQQIDDLLPVASSRLPVGSSATRIAGSGASARASATRCCSPPDNCAG